MKTRAKNGIHWTSAPSTALNIAEDRTVRMVVVPVDPGPDCVLVCIPSLPAFSALVMRTAASPDAKRAAVGGNYEFVLSHAAVSEAGFSAYCNSAGENAHLPLNLIGGRLAASGEDPIYGALVLARK